MLVRGTDYSDLGHLCESAIVGARVRLRDFDRLAVISSAAPAARRKSGDNWERVRLRSELGTELGNGN